MTLNSLFAVHFSLQYTDTEIYIVLSKLVSLKK